MGHGVDSQLLLHVESSVATLTLNRPRALNALTIGMLDEMDSQLGSLAERDDVRVLVMTGRGRAFCAGADLKSVAATETDIDGVVALLDKAVTVFARLREFPKPVVAMLNGLTMAGGLELAMCADIVIAAESATIGDGHANYGVYPGAGGAALLPRLVPQNVALYLLLTGSLLTAAEMKRYGWVSEVHPDDRLPNAVAQLANRIALKSPLALRRMKEVARASLDKPRSEALLHEQHMLRQHLQSFDFREGLSAFLEGRIPAFQGR